MKLPKFLAVMSLILAVGAFTAFAASPVTLAEATPVTFELDLTGANEVPPVEGPTNGLARLTFDADTNELTWVIFVHGISGGAVTASHIHNAAAGANGPVIITLSPVGFVTLGGSAILTDEQVTELKAGNLYINVHSQDNPGGFLRGQLSLPTGMADIMPPSTGDAGLAGQASSGLGAVGIVVAVASLVFGAGMLSLRMARRRI